MCAALMLLGLFTRLLAVALANIDDLHSTLRLQYDNIILDRHILNVLGDRTDSVSCLSCLGNRFYSVATITSESG